MDITPQDNTTQPISDDQELAKALAGVSLDEPAEAPSSSLPSAESIQPADATTGASPSLPPAPSPAATLPAAEPAPSLPSAEVPAAAAANASNLETIKLDALKELRPLMDKVELPADEKFDTYLMLLRSTDDSSLIAPAHAAAQSIADEKRKAEALLEVIKEIDYLSRKDTPQS